MGLFLVAAGVLAHEVLLTRVFSVLMWYHFASLAIAVTLFGLSIGGLVPYLLPRRGTSPLGIGAGRRHGDVPAGWPWLSAASGLAAAAPYAVLLALARRPLWGGRLLAVFHQPYFEPFRAGGSESLSRGDALQVGLLLLLLSLPFVGAGAVFATAFARRGREGKTYLLVMGGSAAGVVGYLAAIRAGSGPAAFLLLSPLFFLAAAAFAGRQRKSLAAAFSLAALLLITAGALEARRGTAEIRFVRGRYEPNLLWTRWDANSRVAVYPVSDEEASKAWGQSPAYGGRLPRQIGMVVDDTGYTALFGTGREPETLPAFGHNLAAAAYRVRGGGSALVIGPGGGKDILCALASGSFRVTAVEVNPLVVRAADREFGDFTGRPYAMPGVRTAVAEGRNFVGGSRDRYGVIQMTQVFGRIPPSAGAFTMTEDHLYTVEAFRSFLSRLEDDGILTVTRFVHERRVFRIFSIAREALEGLGAADPARHVVALRDRGLLNVLVRRTPWPADEIAALRRFAGAMRFTVVIAPDEPPRGLAGEVLSGEAERGGGAFDYSAPTDDRPFFYYTLAPRSFLGALSPRAAEFEDRGVAALRLFLLAAGLLCAAFIVLPAALLARGDPERPAFGGSAYMVLAGLAYIAWEIVMIRKVTLLFGAPVVSFAAGLTMVLAFSALGGWLAGRERAPLPGCGLAVAAALVSAYLLLMDRLIAPLSGAPLAWRWAAAAAYAFPPSVLMGRFFPVGLRIFGRSGGPVPFYFAANGAASVFGAALAQAMAMNLGYRITTAFGAVLYVGCAVAAARAGRKAR